MPENLTEMVSIRLPEDMMQELSRMAEGERRPVSMMTRILLEEAIAARARKAAKNGK